MPDIPDPDRRLALQAYEKKTVGSDAASQYLRTLSADPNQAKFQAEQQQASSRNFPQPLDYSGLPPAILAGLDQGTRLGPTTAVTQADLRSLASERPPTPRWPSQLKMLQLGLTPQEQNLYQHHLDNLNTGKAVANPDGSMSTLLQMTVEQGGRFYSIPSVWDGKELSAKDAIARAAAFGWHNWPAYATELEAQARYDKMHALLAGDITPTGR